MIDPQQQKLQSVVMGQMPGMQKQSTVPPANPAPRVNNNIDFMDSSAFSSGYSNQAYSAPAASSAPTWSAPSGGFGVAGGGAFYEGAIGGSIGGVPAGGRGGGGGPVNFDDEPPLLEELGIDFGKICSRTISVLNPIRRVSKDMVLTRNQDGSEVGDSDMAGPLLVALLLGASMLLRGKVHFGYIYGVGGVGSLSLWMVLTLMSEKGLGFWQMTSILGYCLLPMVLLAFLSVFLSPTSLAMSLLSPTVIGWCTWRSSEMLVLSMGVQNERALVGYPVALFYTCFALLAVF